MLIIMNINFSRLFLWLYCYIAAFFWQCIFDAIHIISGVLLRLCKYTEQQIIRISEISDEYFSD